MYKAEINGVLIHVDTVEELEKLIKKFGRPGKTGMASVPPFPSIDERVDSGATSDKDLTLLLKFVDAYPAGLPPKELQMRLNVNRKALKKGLEGWARRVGLWTSNFDSTFFRGIYSGKRGYKLTKEAFNVGKDISKHEK